MRFVSFTLLLLLALAAARPTFKKVAKGFVSYSTRPLEAGVVALDSDENIQSLSCSAKGASMTLTAKAKPSGLKKGVLVTGGKEWNCNGKKEFYFNITSVGEYKNNKVTVTTHAAAKSAFFVSAQGSAKCQAVLKEARKLVQEAKTTATTVSKLVKDAAKKSDALKKEGATLEKHLKTAMA